MYRDTADWVLVPELNVPYHNRDLWYTVGFLLMVTSRKPRGITIETFRIDYYIRTPKVEKLSLQPIR